MADAEVPGMLCLMKLPQSMIATFQSGLAPVSNKWPKLELPALSAAAAAAVCVYVLSHSGPGHLCEAPWGVCVHTCPGTHV